MNNNENSQHENSKKKRIIQPSFYIDDGQRVICESHSQIDRIRVLSSFSAMPELEEAQQLEKILTCKTCKHYHNDECFFPKEEIDKIESDRLDYTFHCNLCGGSIDRPLTIMYSLYNKHVFKVDVPTVCCSCFSTLEDDSFLSNTRRRIIPIVLSSVLSSIFFLSLIAFFFYSFRAIHGWIFLLFFLIMAIWAYFIFPNVRSIIFLLRGREYYKKTYGKIKHQTDQYVDDFPFD